MNVPLVDHVAVEVEAPGSPTTQPHPLTPHDIIEQDYLSLYEDVMAIRTKHDHSRLRRGKLCKYRLHVTLPNCTYVQPAKKGLLAEHSKVISQLEIHPGLDELTLRCSVRRIQIERVAVKEPEWVPYDNGKKRYFVIEVIVWP